LPFSVPLTGIKSSNPASSRKEATNLGPLSGGAASGLY
jgi:hypothetical protein